MEQDSGQLTSRLWALRRKKALHDSQVSALKLKPRALSEQTLQILK